MKKFVLAILAVLILLAGLSLILYPTLSDYYNRIHQSGAIVDYAEKINGFDDDTFKRMWDEAVLYNEQLFNLTRGIETPESEKLDYYEVLNVTSNGMMSYIDIPSINCHLPLCHGTDEGTLQSNAGHVETSSLPVGGENTHCVISGHTGLPSAKLFTYLDAVHEGDIFTLSTLGVVLTYEVDQVLVVLPHEADALGIVPGMDYCTLVTCTPYGVNSHRLLVRGHRIETPETVEEEIKAKVEEAQKQTSEPFYIALAVAIGLLILIIILVIVRAIARKKAKNRAEQINATGEDKTPKQS